MMKSYAGDLRGHQGTFQSEKKTTGLNAPRIVPAIVEAHQDRLQRLAETQVQAEQRRQHSVEQAVASVVSRMIQRQL